MRVAFAVLGLMVVCTGWVSAHPAQALPVDYPLVVGFERFYSVDDDEDYLAEGGMLLLNELNCVRCHKPPEKLKTRLQGRQATNLEGVGSRMDALDIELMIRNPRFVKRGTIMPSLFAGADRNLEDIKALKHYLASQKQEVKVMPKGDEEEGRVLYHEIGCVACHAPETGYRPKGLLEGTKLELLGLPSVPLSMVDRYSRSALGRFLLNPQHLRPSGRMPGMKLSEREAADLATYLKSGPQVKIPKELRSEIDGGNKFVLDAKLAKRGHEVFLEKKCVACHTAPGSEKLSVKPAKALAELEFEKRVGCLADVPSAGGVPWFYLDELQIKAMQLALKNLSKQGDESLAQKIDHTMMRYDCYACHSRDGKGGPETSREPFFGVRDIGAMSLGRWGNLVPPLDKVGRKLTPAWFEKMLWGEGGEVRPYVSTRMPQFRKADVGHLITAFEKADKKEVPVEIDQRRRPDGLLKGDDYEMKPDKEGRAIVFRTFLEGVGTQAIAVGFPGGINAAFDAQEVRWKIVWRGTFLDALGTWDDRCYTPAVPLGGKVESLGVWMPLSLLLDSDSADRLGFDAGFEMQGFRLNKQGVPTFLYQWQGISVEDRLEPMKDGKGLKRTLVLNGKKGGGSIYFRGLKPKVKKREVKFEKGKAVIEEELTW